MDGAGWFSEGNRAEIVRAILTPKVDWPGIFL
jgi:hypothetical protein